jgi:hypothetical protein
VQFAKRIAHTVLPRAAFNRALAAAKSVGAYKALSTKYGHFRSIKTQMCVDRTGNPIPWYTYPATEYLSNLNFRDSTVFEYGSGNSSRWWASRCNRLVSIESDKAWYDIIKSSLNLPNFEYRLADPPAYAKAIEGYDGAFDVVVVDGIERADCANAAIAHIRRLGGKMLILDNSDWYPKLVPHIRTQLEWLEIDFHGFGPLNKYSWTTSLFINPASAKDLAPQRPLMSLAGVVMQNDDDLK